MAESQKETKRGSWTLRSRAVSAYVAVFVCFTAAAALLVWNFRIHMDDGYRHRLLELRRASEQLETLVEIHLKTVANLHRSVATREIRDGYQWLEEMVAQQPFVRYREVKEKTDTDGKATALSLVSKPDWVEVSPDLRLSNSKLLTLDPGRLGPRLGVRGETLCWTRPDSSTCLRPGDTIENGADLRLFHGWQVRLPRPEGLKAQEVTRDRLGFQEGTPGFWVSDTEVVSAGSWLLGVRLREILEREAAEGVTYGFELENGTTFSGDDPLPEDLRLWIEAPAEEQRAAIGRPYVFLKDHYEPLELRSEPSKLRASAGQGPFTGVRLRETVWGNWKLETEEGDFELVDEQGKRLRQLRDGLKSSDEAKLRVEICHDQTPCFLGKELREIRTVADLEGWKPDPTSPTTFAGPESRRVRLWLQPPKDALGGDLIGSEEVTWIAPDRLRRHKPDAFVPLATEGPLGFLGASFLNDTPRERLLVEPDGEEIRLSYRRFHDVSARDLDCSDGQDDPKREGGPKRTIESIPVSWRGPETRALEPVAEVEIPCSGTSSARFTIDLLSLLRASAWVEDFDQWALFDEEGTSLLAHEHHPALFRLDAPGVWQTLQSGSEAGEGEESVSVDSIGAFQRDFEIGDTEVRVFCQSVPVPQSIQLPSLVFEGSRDWHLCGVLETARARREAVGLDPSRTAGAILLALLLLGMLAYAKPILMAPQERLRRMDLILLTTSTVLLLVVLAVSNIAVYRGLNAQGDLDRQLRLLAVDVQGKLLGDLGLYLAELKNLDQVRCGERRASCEGRWAHHEKSESTTDKDDGVFREVRLLAEDPVDLSAVPAADQGPAKAEEKAADCRLGPRILPGTPAFSSIFWIDAAGDQVHKATSRTRNTPAVAVADRAYFSEIQRGHGIRDSCFPRPDPDPSAPLLCAGDDEPRIFLETNRSKTTGEPFFALSRKSACAEGPTATDSGPRVVALTGKLPSMEAWVTRPFDFAVVDSEGKVVLSSHDRLRIKDHLLKVVQERTRATKALRLEAPLTLDLGFGNRTYRAHVRPLLPAGAWKGMPPLRVVSFYELELARTLVAEAILMAVGLLSLYIAGVFLLALLLRRKLHQLFWPRLVRGGGSYAWEVLILLGLATGTVLFWVHQESAKPWAFLVLLVLDVSALALYFARERSGLDRLRRVPFLSRVLRSESKGKRVSARRSFEIMAFLLGIMIGVVPGLFFFELSWQFQVQSLDSRQQRERGTAWVEREQRLEREWKSLLSESRWEERLASPGDWFPLPVLSPDEAWEGVPSGSSSTGRWTDTALGLLSDSLPIYNDTSEKIRFQWREIQEESDVPTAYAWVLVPLFVSIAVVLWMFSVRRRLEIRDGAPPPIERLDHWLALCREAGDPRLVVLTSADQWSRARSEPDVEIVDLAAGPSVREDDDRPIFIFGLSQALAERELREPTLALLSDLLSRESSRPIWMFTSTDPYRLLEEAVAEGGGRRESGAILDFGDAARWVYLLGRFERVFAEIDREHLEAVAEDHRDDVFWPILWGCSDSERLAMLQLAGEGIVNPKQASAVQSLMWRGLLTRDDPELPLSFFSKKFRDFVLEDTATDRLLTWEREAGKKGWKSLRSAFAVLLTILFCALFLLDSELLEGLTGLLTGLAAILPLGLGLLSRFDDHG